MGFRLGDHLPAALYKTPATTTWGTTGNTCTITDPKITPSTQVEIWVTGTVPQAGQWAIQVKSGSAIITSSDSENSTLPLSYLLF